MEKLFIGYGTLVRRIRKSERRAEYGRAEHCQCDKWPHWLPLERSNASLTCGGRTGGRRPPAAPTPAGRCSGLLCGSSPVQPTEMLSLFLGKPFRIALRRSGLATPQATVDMVADLVQQDIVKVEMPQA